jgi:hypothetical protein
MLALGYMFENGWGIQQDIDVAKRWYAKSRSAGTKGAANHLRQIKAGSFAESDSVALHETPEPNVRAPSATQPPGLTNAPERSEPRQDGQALSSEQSSGAPIDAIASMLVKAKDYLIPVVLLVLGLFMGFLVFRWMRGSQPHDSVF